MSYIRNQITTNRIIFSDNVRFNNNLDIISGIDIFELNSTSDSLINGGIVFEGQQISYSADVNFSCSIIDFNDRFFVSGSNIRFPGNSDGSEKVIVDGNIVLQSISFVKTDGIEFGYIGFGENGLYIGKSGPPIPNGVLTVHGEVRIDPLNSDTNFYYNDIDNFVCMGKNGSSTLSKFTVISGSYMSAAKVEPNSILTCMNGGNNSSTVGNIQFIGHYARGEETFTNWNNFGQGILLSSADRNTGINKHWFITPMFDGVGTVIAEDGFFFWDPPTSATLRENWIAFCFLSGTMTNPVTTITSNGNTHIKAYIREQSAYGNLEFTGQHRNLFIGDDSSIEEKIGLIVVSDGTYCETTDPNDDSGTTVSINESLPKVRLSTERNDKKVFGVVSDKEDEENVRKYTSGNWVSVYEKRTDDHRLIINSVGEGAIWVTNINGNFENGDYITSCEIPGHGMRQEAQNIKNYTVAKITCDCTFDIASSVYRCEEFQFSGSIYRRAFVGCTYHCG